MNLLKTIIERLNQRIEVANIFDKQFGLCELNANGNDKAWVHYIGNGQAEVVTNFDAKQGTLFWAKRGKVTVVKTDAFRVSGCKQLYITSFPLTAYAVVRKSHLPCDSEDAQDWLASRIYKITSGTDPVFKQAIGVINYEVVPSGYINEIKTLTANYDWACVSVDFDIQVITTTEDGCYDICQTGDIPLPDLPACTPCLTDVAVDGVTIIGNGTAADPLVAIGGGGEVGTLQEVTDLGNSTTNDIDFIASAGLSFDNGAFFRKGTTDAGNGGAKGTAQICSISYELKWEAGRLYYMEQNGFTIRDVTHNFTFVPQVTDDSSKGFVVGSRWSLDDGTVYVCSDDTIGAAVWAVVSVGGVTSVTATTPLSSSGGSTPDISIQPANLFDDGYITSADFTLFYNKFDVPTGLSTDYLDGTGTPTPFPIIPTLTSELTNDSGFITIGDVPMQVNSDWNSSSGLSEILNKPTIPAAQVNSDWNSSSGLSEILNKPTIPILPATIVEDVTATLPMSSSGGTTPDISITQASTSVDGYLSQTDWNTFNYKFDVPTGTTSDYLDGLGTPTLFPTIPAAQVNSDWNATSGVAKILNKPSIPTVTPSALTKTDDTNVTLTLGGSPTTSLLAATSLTLGWSGTLADARIASAATWNAKQNAITTGTTLQYFRGDLSLNTFPTALPPSGAASGDLSGTYPSPTVDRIHGIDMQSGTPTADDVWIYGGPPAKWQHQKLHSNQVTNDSSVSGTNVDNALTTLDSGKQATLVSGTNIKTINSTTLLGSGNINTGTVTSVAALTLGTTGTDLTSSVATGTTTPVITLNVPTASAANRGALSAADWTTFNSKGSGTVTSVTGTSPIASSGGVNPAISIANAAADGTTKGAAAFTAADFNATAGVISIDYTNGQAASAGAKGFLTATDWTTFNGKQATITPAALTKIDDTNVTLTLGGTPTTALLQAASITAGWSGTLADARITSAATWNAKQAALVSGTNIKTINSTSLLGSGNYATPFELVIAASDESTSLTIGTAKITFRMPRAVTLTAVRASLTTAQTSGSLLTINIKESGTTILSTKITINNTQKTSTTATTLPVISDIALADDAEMTIDVDQIGDGTAKGLKVYLIGNYA